jgi:hypothetical protein
MNPRLILGGLKSYLPVPAAKYKGTGGTVTGLYCYSVWLRHLTLIARHVGAFQPRAMVELGPGDSIGLGLAALLTGVESYVGLDVLEHASPRTNVRVLDELVELFRRHAPIPDEHAFPLLHPRLHSYDFPERLLDERRLAERTSFQNVAALRTAVRQLGNDGTPIQYRCPWSPSSVEASTVDLVVTQVALQDMDHADARDDLRANLAAMARWLKRGGVMSHQIDFSCPGGDPWNHHWAYGDVAWTVVRGRRPYYVNRVPLSEYMALCEEVGCAVVGVERVIRDGLTSAQVAPPFRQLPEQDFHTAAALLIAVKR